MNSGLFSLAREHPAVVGVSGTFVRSMEQARLRVYLTLIALDMSSIFVGYLIAGEIRTGYLVHAQSFRLIAVMVPTFLGVALNNGAYSIAALERPGNGIAKACEAAAFRLVMKTLVVSKGRVSWRASSDWVKCRYSTVQVEHERRCSSSC